jgi:hypothetical protein
MIARFDAEADGDLMLARHRGIAWQRDMSHRVAYDEAYFDKCRGYEGQEIARKINAGRVALVDKHVGPLTHVLDVGVGSGEFIRNRSNTFGFDVNRHAVEWLKREGRYADNIPAFKAFTFWDVIEHVEDPEPYFRAMPPGAHVFTSLPIFADLGRIRESRHYRPGEHLYYWTEPGFVDWMAMHGFALLDRQDYETAAGRDSILSFAFCKSLPGRSETLAQYQEMHGRFYGSSAHLYFDLIAREVLALDPKSILDFGCGRSDLVAHFWKDGARRIAKHDAAIGIYQEMPEGPFDLVLCTDVMEHILMSDVDRVLAEIRAKSRRALFTISMRPARAKLPDGRNAHVTLLTAGEWLRWIESVFGKAARIATQWDHILMVRTW